MLSAFSATLRERLDVAEVPQAAVCDAIVSSLRLGSAELVLGLGRTTTAGTPAGPRTEVPLRHRGVGLGSVTVTPRPGERVLDERDAELVAALADSAAPAIAALQLTDSLQQARNRWWPPARRNDAGCAATSTTASVRRWPSGCSWTRRATWSRTRWRPS